MAIDIVTGVEWGSQVVEAMTIGVQATRVGKKQREDKILPQLQVAASNLKKRLGEATQR